LNSNATHYVRYGALSCFIFSSEFALEFLFLPLLNVLAALETVEQELGQFEWSERPCSSFHLVGKLAHEHLGRYCLPKALAVLAEVVAMRWLQLSMSTSFATSPGSEPTHLEAELDVELVQFSSRRLRHIGVHGNQ
jgi:hypothetical protein